MGKIYNISKGQLATLWIFGALAWVWTSEEFNYNSDLAEVLLLIIPFILVFYTIGWRNQKR